MIGAPAQRAAINTAGTNSHMGKSVFPHTARHSCATHFVEQNTDIRVIRGLVGTYQAYTQTASYTFVATNLREDREPAPISLRAAQAGSARTAGLTRAYRVVVHSLRSRNLFPGPRPACAGQCRPRQPRPLNVMLAIETAARRRSAGMSRAFEDARTAKSRPTLAANRIAQLPVAGGKGRRPR